MEGWGVGSAVESGVNALFRQSGAGVRKERDLPFLSSTVTVSFWHFMRNLRVHVRRMASE